MSSNQDWRVTLQEWLQKNPKVMPDDLKQLREEFVKSFPIDKLPEMTLDQYAAGKHDREIGSTFCHWIEFRTVELGSIKGGSAAKFGIYWSGKNQVWKWDQSFQTDNVEVAFQKLKTGLLQLIHSAELGQFDDLDKIGDKGLGKNRNSVRAKPLYLYFPDDFLPISNPTHLDRFLKYFNQIPKEGLHARNRQLLEFLKSQNEFHGFDTVQMMHFLYHLLPQREQDIADVDIEVEDKTVTLLNLKTTQNLLNIAQTTKNIILYGSPGTGKTYLTNKFAQQLLRNQIKQNLSLSRKKINILKNLKWYEVVAIAMYHNKMLKKRKSYLISRLLRNDYLIEGYWKLFQMKKEELDSSIFPNIVEPARSVFITVQTHTQPEIYIEGLSVDQNSRLHPFLFEPTVDFNRYLTDSSTRIKMMKLRDSWWLTETGHKYVEENLMPQLIELGNTSLDISDYKKFITFHQSFAYEEFVEGIKPITDEAGEVSYRVVDGVFKQICRQAELDPDNEYLIIIDEINRANIAKVFGELITLIEDDKRIGMPNELKVTLPYSQEEFGVPKNLYILGTMNTSDRSIALLDIALRRRFTFIELKPDPELLKDKVIEGIQCDRVLTQLNKSITLLIGRDYQIGHSYFMNIENLEDLRFAWYHRIVPLLQEYFYHDSKRLRAVIGDKFMQAIEIDATLKTSLSEFLDPEIQYEIIDLQGDEFKNAMSSQFTF